MGRFGCLLCSQCKLWLLWLAYSIKNLKKSWRMENNTVDVIFSASVVKFSIICDIFMLNWSQRLLFVIYCSLFCRFVMLSFLNFGNFCFKLNCFKVWMNGLTGRFRLTEGRLHLCFPTWLKVILVIPVETPRLEWSCGARWVFIGGSHSSVISLSLSLCVFSSS